MMSELLDMSDRQNASQSAFKVVKIELRGGYLCLNNKLDQPIFNKNALSYDKYELAKVITYQQLELLFRPFKEDPSVKDFLRWRWILITYGIFFVLLTSLMFVLKPKVAAFLNIFVFSTIVMMLVVVSSIVKGKKVTRALTEYCKKLNDQQEQVSIKIVNYRPKRIYRVWIEVNQPLFLEQLGRPYIRVQSKKVRSDKKYIKIYKQANSDIGNWLCDLKEQPIYQESQFEFETRQLNRFIYFDELQLLLRPFKANYYYQRRLFWNRIVAVSFVSVALIIMPLYLLKDNQLMYNIVAVVYVSVSQSMFWLGLYKSVKMNDLMWHQFKKYCQDISMANPNIEILAHLRDTNKRACASLSTSLYCLQIRIKGLQSDIEA